MRRPSGESSAAIGQNPNKLQTLGNHHTITGFHLVGKEKEQRGLVAIIRRVNKDGALTEEVGVLLQQEVAESKHKRVTRMNHIGEGKAGFIHRTHGLLGKTNPFIAAEHWSKIAAITSGDKPITFT